MYHIPYIIPLLGCVSVYFISGSPVVAFIIMGAGPFAVSKWPGGEYSRKSSGKRFEAWSGGGCSGGMSRVRTW